MLKSPKVRREREKGRTPEEGTNSLKKSFRTGRSLSRSEEGNKSKEMDKEMKTMIREIREKAGIRVQIERGWKNGEKGR
jgi:hypothetical protein